MSRLYIVILLFFPFLAFSQGDLKKYLKFAQQKYQEGDYIYALQYYDRAMEIDSNSINTLWEYAQTLRAYKDYPKAAFYYGKVYDRENGQLYPESLVYYGLMFKQQGKYDEAIEVFKRAKKKYRGNSRGYLSQKSRRELESCIWAKSNIGDSTNIIFEQLPEHINTPNAEFAHRVHEGNLMFSSLRADSISAAEEVYDLTYRTHLYQSEITEEGFGEFKEIEGLNWKDFSSGNGSFSLDKKRFYFSHCGEDGSNYRCKILVAYVEGNRYVDIDTLGEIINEPNTNTTMPFIGKWEDDEVLFYASDREGGKGGMDIWYSFIKKGSQFTKPRNIKLINSPDNELSPFWDSETQTLYFSSSWHNGFGGYDVFKSEYINGQFTAPKNMMEPINSPANDLYYFHTSSKDTSFFSSNRLGSNYSKNPTCCSDIYMVYQPLEEPLPSITETLEDLNKRLPVTLYFHNDIPNPRSWDTTTKVNYINSYHDYLAMLERYQKEYSAGLKGEKAEDAKDDIEDFFTEYIRQGVKDLEQFRNLMLIELDRGRKIELTVKGFASPLAQTEYNVNLTMRRINSLKNYLYSYNGGVFRKYMDRTASNGGELRIKSIPFGEYSADQQIVSNNPNDKKNSIYSRLAASERKIEIQSVDIIRQEEKVTLLTADELVFNAGAQKSGATLSKVFILKNSGETPIQINEVITSSDEIRAEYEKKIILPGETLEFNMIFDTSGLEGHKVGTVEIRYNEVEKGLELSIMTELEGTIQKD